MARRNKKAQYKHDKEVKENIKLWDTKLLNADDEEFELYVGDEDDDDEEESNEEDSDIND